MTTETSANTEGASTPATDSTTGRPAAAVTPGSGPLARFKRPSEGSQEASSAPAEAGGSPAASKPTAMVPAGTTPVGFRPRGRGDRPQSRRDKEREEDRQVDRELAAERP